MKLKSLFSYSFKGMYKVNHYKVFGITGRSSKELLGSKVWRRASCQLGRSLSRYIGLRSQSKVAGTVGSEVRLRNDRGKCRALNVE